MHLTLYEVSHLEDGTFLTLEIKPKHRQPTSMHAVVIDASVCNNTITINTDIGKMCLSVYKYGTLWRLSWIDQNNGYSWDGWPGVFEDDEDE